MLSGVAGVCFEKMTSNRIARISRRSSSLVADEREHSAARGGSDSGEIVNSERERGERVHRSERRHFRSRRTRHHSIHHLDPNNRDEIQTQTTAAARERCRNRRASLPAYQHELIENFFSSADSEMSDTDDSSTTQSSFKSVDHLRRAKSFHDRNKEKKGDGLRRVRSFKTTSKGLVNRGDSYKKKKNTVQSGTTVLYGADDSDACEQRVQEITLSPTTQAVNDEVPSNYFRVLMIGSPGVGKSSVMNQFMTSEFVGFTDYNISQSEDDRKVTLQVDGEESTIEFLNSEFDQEYLESVSIDGYVVVYSITDRSSFDLALDWLKEIKEEVSSNRALILAANKSDLVRKRTISAEDGRHAADRYDCKYIEISAALNHRVDELLVGILKQILLKARGIWNDEHENSLHPTQTKDRKSSFRRTKRFLERLFHGGHSSKDKRTENLYVK